MPLVDDARGTPTLAPAMADRGSEDWTGDRATRWVAMADAVEGQLAPVSDVLFAAAALRPGERVLDVGCGTGPTTRRAAELVAPGGVVVGADVSAEMIDAATAAGTPDGAGIEWVAADVATWQPDGDPFDVVHLPLRRDVLRRPGGGVRQPRPA